MGGYNPQTGKYEYSNQSDINNFASSQARNSGGHAWMNYNKRPVSQGTVGFKTQGIGGQPAPQPMSDGQLNRAAAGNAGYSMGPGGRSFDGPDAADLMRPPPQMQAPIDTGVRPGAVPTMNAVESARRGIGGTVVPQNEGYGTDQGPMAPMGAPRGTDPRNAALNVYPGR